MMSFPSLTNRQLLVTTPLGPDALLLVGFTGREAVSELFAFQLDLLADNNTKVPFEKLLGHGVTVHLRLHGAKDRYFNGIVSRVTQGDRNEFYTQYRAEMVPQLWLWTRKVQSRIFQHLSVPDILKQVLNGLKVVFDIHGHYHPRDYCVQYRESDFAFASRLMEEEGIYYFFKHEHDSHELVVTDVPNKHPEVPVQSDAIYLHGSGAAVEESRITSWEKSQELRSGKYTLWDHSFELTGKNLEAGQQILDKVAIGQVTHPLKVGGNEKLEIYDYPGGYAQRFDGVDKGGSPRPADVQLIYEDNQRTVKIRMEEEARAGLAVRGTGDYSHFTAGHQFTLHRHFDANGPYVLTAIDHLASLGESYRSGQDSVLKYENRFTAIPAALPYRPSRVTSKPAIGGAQTATVVGPVGEEIFVDKYGRVKVQFHWDRQGKNNIDSSCWIRVGQVWAGKRWGGFFWPRIGHEVIVIFEESDPDRPLIVGSVYNSQNLPPLELPAGKTLGGIKSCIFTGNPGTHFNAIIFHDQPGQEYVHLHSEKHEMSNSETNRFQYVHQAQFNFHGNL